MERVHVSGVPAVARWQALTREHQLHWLLRLGIIGCFIGHGATALPAGSEAVNDGPKGGQWKTWVLASSTDIPILPPQAGVLHHDSQLFPYPA